MNHIVDYDDLILNVCICVNARMLFLYVISSRIVATSELSILRWWSDNQ